MSLEDEVRRQLEMQTAQEQVKLQCPVEEDVDIALGIASGIKKIGRSIKRHVKAGTRTIKSYATGGLIRPHDTARGKRLYSAMKKKE